MLKFHKKNRNYTPTKSDIRRTYWWTVFLGLCFFAPGAWLSWVILKDFQFSWLGLLDRSPMLLLCLIVMGMGIWFIAHRNMAKTEDISDSVHYPEHHDDKPNYLITRVKDAWIRFVLGLVFIGVGGYLLYMLMENLLFFIEYSKYSPEIMPIGPNQPMVLNAWQVLSETTKKNALGGLLLFIIGWGLMIRVLCKKPQTKERSKFRHTEQLRLYPWWKDELIAWFGVGVFLSIPTAYVVFVGGEQSKIVLKGVVAVLLLWGLYGLSSRLNPKVILSLKSQAVLLDSKVDIHWQIDGRAASYRRLTIKLISRLTINPGSIRGRSRWRQTSTVIGESILSRDELRVQTKGQLSFELPSEALPTAAVGRENNDWIITVEGVAAGWKATRRDEYELIVQEKAVLEKKQARQAEEKQRQMREKSAVISRG